MSQTVPTFSRTESNLDWDLDNDLVEREEQAKYIRNKRRLVVVAVISIFVLTSVVMVMSVDRDASWHGRSIFRHRGPRPNHTNRRQWAARKIGRC